MSQASYNLVIIISTYVNAMISLRFNWSTSTTHRFYLLLYSNMKLYHGGAAMISSVIDDMLILMHMLEYYQIRVVERM